MFQRVCIATFVLLIVSQNVDCAMKKSWKSAANFDDEIPKFTPFDHQVDLSKTSDVDLNEVSIKTSPAASHPAQAANTLNSKISSKIKAPPKYIADMYKQLNKEAKKNTKDFGAFDVNIQGDAPAAEPAIILSSETTSEKQQPDPTKEQHEIEEILGALSEIVARESTPSGSIESKSEPEADDDDLEISTYNNEESNSTQYKVGPLMNVTIDSEDSVVNVNLDQAELKEIFTGRGRKHSMLERVVPLFILPFLIQSAVIPFMVTMIKLFLMKSLFAGKIAVFLLLLGALKSHQNGIYMKSMHQSPYFPPGYPPAYPERRIETAFDGYKVEGKPAAFVN